MKKSFTLIELIVVIAIIAILAAIIAPNAFRAIEKANISTAIADLKAYKTADASLYADTGHRVIDGINADVLHTDALFLESGNNDLDANVSSWSGWDGPYIEKTKVKHPWGGWYLFADGMDFDNPANGLMEIEIHMDDWCYGKPLNTDCPIPENARARIDQILDDGNNTTGNIQRYPVPEAYNTVCYITTWDYK